MHDITLHVLSRVHEIVIVDLCAPDYRHRSDAPARLEHVIKNYVNRLIIEKLSKFNVSHIDEVFFITFPHDSHFTCDIIM